MFSKTIEQVYQDEAALELTASDRRHKLAELKKEIGGLLLDDPEQESALTEKLVRATMQIDVDRGKIEASRARRRRMVEDSRRKQAADRRAAAERDREESESIVKRVNAQLQKIAEIEGLAAAYDVSVVQHHSEVPRHVRLLSDAETAEAQARDLEQPAKFDKAGRISGMTARELFEKSRTDQAAMTPTLEQFERIETETHEAALRGTPPTQGFYGNGEYMQKGGWAPLAVANRGIVRHVEFRGTEIVGVTFELGPFVGVHANDNAAHLPAHYTGWSSRLAYATVGGTTPRPNPPEAA